MTDIDLGYQMLAAAIVTRAAEDYDRALRALRRDPEDYRAQSAKRDCELFFGAGMHGYVDLDGAVIMSVIQNRVEGGEKRVRRYTGL